MSEANLVTQFEAKMLAVRVVDAAWRNGDDVLKNLLRNRCPVTFDAEIDES